MKASQKADGRRQKEVGTRKAALRARRPTSAFLLTSSFCLLTSALSCGAPRPRFLSIATGGTGGVYYPYGGALARLISEKIPNTQATAEVTGASVDNLKYLQVGKVDLAFTLADTLAEAVKGEGPFKATGAIGSIRALAVLYTNYTHVVVRPGIARRVADLKGRAVSVGSPGSGTELLADRVLAAAGLDPRQDIARYTLGVSDSAGAFKDGKLDAFFWSGGLPTAAIQDLAATPGVAMALIAQDELLPFLQRDFGRGLYSLAIIPAGAYRGVDADVPTVGVKNLLVASSALPDDLVGEILRVMFEHKPSLVAAHPEARHLGRPTSFDDLPAAYHAGAVFMANYAVALASVAEQLAQRAGVPPDIAGRLYLPLLSGAVRNLEGTPPVRALTGPIRRGDISTVRAHLAALSGTDRRLYAVLGLQTLSLARRAGLADEPATELELLLSAHLA